MPGVRVKVQGLYRTEVLAVTEMVYRRMMIGYVDRMGGRHQKVSGSSGSHDRRSCLTPVT